MKRFDYVDALRGLAILGVITAHTISYGHFDQLPFFIKKIASQGALGVELFFVISAFTLFLSLEKRSCNGKIPTSVFFIRRFFRIAPMYYTGIVYYLLQDGLGARFWLGNEPSVTTANIISNFVFLHGFNPYWVNSIVPGGWSIAVEVMFYLMIPFLFYKIKNINQAFNFFLVSLFLMTALQLLLVKLNPIQSFYLWHQYISNFYFPRQLPLFALGIITYFLIIKKEELSGLAAKVAAVILFIAIYQLVKTGFNEWLFMPKQLLVGLVCSLMIIGLDKLPLHLLVNKFFQYIGKISYSAYLVHFAVIYWLSTFHFLDAFRESLIGFFVALMIIIFITIIIATITYRLIELPFQRLGITLIKRIEFNYPKLHQHI